MNALGAVAAYVQLTGSESQKGGARSVRLLTNCESWREMAMAQSTIMFSFVWATIIQKQCGVGSRPVAIAVLRYRSSSTIFRKVNREDVAGKKYPRNSGNT